MRVQLHMLFEEFISEQAAESIVKKLRFKSGATVPNRWGYAWEEFFENGELRDILDLITITNTVLAQRENAGAAEVWRKGVQAVFDSQNAKYRITPGGSVVLRVDENFETERASTLAGLEDKRYSGARIEFIDAYKALSATDPDGKRAVRAVFEACEIVLKLTFPGARRLAAPELGQHLSPFVARYYASDAPAQDSANKLVQGFTDWVAAAQFYRHGQGQEEPNQPPLELAVLLVSTGASHLRWLIQLDKAKLASGG
ncbi:conserved hypothetical protein [Methylobacterium nodulans ORS 2060]|uniref:Uncharacterized protein n=2 Tax=Methylobacterium nodulans TaxID=114616 RepID=B8IPC7_METNO|nr:conserved hypothetical protein [Methylobacterium nodulans ORS 2060]